MANILKITVENADELLNAGAYGTGAIIRVQSATTEAGTFADVSGTGSTPTIPLVSGDRTYTGYDPVGTSTTWYRTRYENVGATRLSDWTPAFLVGSDAAGYLCSLYDARQRLFPEGTTDTTEDENLIGYIIQVSSFIETRCGRWFAPRPSATYLFSPRYYARTLYFPKGIRALTALGYAVTDQPDTGGTYTALASTDWSLQPGAGDRDNDWPATRIVLLGSTNTKFYPGINRVQATFTAGFDAVPGDIEQVALNLVVAAHRERGTSGGDTVTINIDGSRTWERALSYGDRMILDSYTARPVG